MGDSHGRRMTGGSRRGAAPSHIQGPFLSSWPRQRRWCWRGPGTTASATPSLKAASCAAVSRVTLCTYNRCTCPRTYTDAWSPLPVGEC